MKLEQDKLIIFFFFEQLKERKTKLDIIYPHKEIYEMHKANIIDAKYANYILHFIV